MVQSLVRLFAMTCVVFAILTPHVSADPLSILDSQCPEGQAANDYEFWEFIENNAMRTAEYYAMDNNPRATFALAEARVIFQMGGDYAGEYLVQLLSSSSTGTALAMLRPGFDFCADPSGLDDERKDLFTVVVAKLDGREF